MQAAFILNVFFNQPKFRYNKDNYEIFQTFLNRKHQYHKEPLEKLEPYSLTNCLVLFKNKTSNKNILYKSEWRHFRRTLHNGQQNV